MKFEFFALSIYIKKRSKVCVMFVERKERTLV